MKKLKLFIVVAGLLVAGSSSAQMKIGYINLDNVVALMPETKKIIDTLLPKFQSDSLNPQLSYYVSEWQRKDSILIADSLAGKKLPKSVRDQMRAEMGEYENIVQNWQAYAQQVMEAKRDQMLGPVYQKVYEAVKTVSKEKGYTHVLTKEAFLVAPDTDDLLIVVAQKLKIKLPPQLQPGATPAGNRPAGN